MIPCQLSRRKHQITLSWRSSMFVGVLLQLLFINTVVGRPMDATHASMTAILTSHRRDNTTIEATATTKCLSYLRTADRNGDSKLSPLEYTEFVDELSGGAFRDVFLIPFGRLPMSLQSNFKALSCPCFNDSGTSEVNQCCSEQDATDSHATTTSIGDLSINLLAQSKVSWLGQICHDTQTVIEKHFGVPKTTTTAPTTTTIRATPAAAPIPSMSECYSSLSLAINNSLTAAEFVTFVNSLTNNQTWSGLQFTQLPTELKQVFLSRVDLSDTDSSFSILHGYGQGQASSSSATTTTVSGQRVAALRDFCSDTLMAMNKLNKVGELTVTRQPSAASVPDPTPRIGSSPPTEEEVVAAGDKLSTSPSLHPILSSPLMSASDIVTTPPSPAVAAETVLPSSSTSRHPTSSTPLVVSPGILLTSQPSPFVAAHSVLTSPPSPVVAADGVLTSSPSPVVAADILPTSSVVSAAEFPTPSAPNQVLTSGSPSPMIALNLCYVAMIVNDRDGNQILDSSEYASFCSKLSGGQLSSISYDDLPLALRNKFMDLSNGSSDGISIEGSRPSSIVNTDQSAFLERICLEVDQAIDQVLNPGPTMSPSVSTDLGMTSQPASAVPAETETPTSRPNIPDSFPTPAALPTRPSRRTRSPFSFGSPVTAPSITSPAFASPSVMPSIGAASAPSSLKPSITPISSPTEALTTEPSLEATSEASSPVRTLPISSSSKPTVRSTSSPTTSIPTPSSSEPTVGSTSSPTTALPSKSSSAPTVKSTSAPTSGLPTLSSSKPTVKSTPDPTPTMEPTRSQTETLSRSPATENLLIRPPPTPANETPSVSMAPSQHVEGIKYYGNVTFTISNAARLDEDHLQSGMTRNHLTAAFRILVQNVTDRMLGKDDSRQLLRREQQRRLQWLLSDSDTRLDRIENAPCPTGVPTGTLCEECYASFVVEAPAQSSSSLSAADDTKLIETELMTAITNGELQKALDEVDPDTLVRIEEGQVRQRDDPVGVYTIAGTSFPTAAIVGCVVGCIVLLVLICLWMCCCGSGAGRLQKGPPKIDRYLSEGPQKPRGLFG